MSNDIYYRAVLGCDEDGLVVIFETYKSVHETRCYAFCVREWDYSHVVSVSNLNKKSLLAEAKTRKTFKRIHKENSRFAFSTKEAALENLRYRKKKQIQHMRRDIEFAEAFLEKAGSLNDLPEDRYVGVAALIQTSHIIPDTEVLVREYYVFG